MNGKRRSVESICASAGRDVESATRPLMAPIYQGSVFEVESLELLDDIYAGSQDGFIYSRDANPNVENLERVVAELENADDAVAFASGMGAIGNTLLSMVEAGDTVLAGDVLYGGTNLLLRQHLPRLGVRVEFVDVTDLGLVERALERSPKVILVESITNPLLRLTDVEGIARLAGERGVRMVVDNTLATPLLMRPLELGADVTIHSATKLLGGHSDVMGGVAAGRFEGYGVDTAVEQGVGEHVGSVCGVANRAGDTDAAIARGSHLRKCHEGGGVPVGATGGVGRSLSGSGQPPAA